MTATCLTSNLARATREALPIVSSKTKLPILANFLIRSRTAGLDVIATDLEAFTVKRAGGKLSNGEEFNITVPARAFSDFVNVFAADDEEIHLTYNRRVMGLTLSVPAFRMTAELKGIDAGEFPAVPEYLEAEGVYVTVPADVLTWLCKFAAKKKKGRVASSGQSLDTLQIEIANGNAFLVASDGRTLALAEYPAQGEVSASFPAKVVKNALKGQGKGDVLLSVTAAALSVNGAMIRAEKHEYPNWRSAANAPFTTTANVDYRKLAEILKPFDKRGGYASFCLNGNLTIFAVDEGGELTGAVDAEKDGPGLSVALSPKAIALALAVDKPKRKETRNVRLELSPAGATIYVTDSIRVIAAAYIEPEPQPEAEPEPEPTPDEPEAVEVHAPSDLTPKPGDCTFCGREWAGGGMCPACREIDEEDAITRRNEVDPDAQERPDDTYPEEADVIAEAITETQLPQPRLTQMTVRREEGDWLVAIYEPTESVRYYEAEGHTLIENHAPPADVIEVTEDYIREQVKPLARTVEMIGLHQNEESARKLAEALRRAFPDEF